MLPMLIAHSTPDHSKMRALSVVAYRTTGLLGRVECLLFNKRLGILALIWAMMGVQGQRSQRVVTTQLNPGRVTRA